MHACQTRCAHHVATAFRLKIRNEVLPYSASVEPKQFEEKITLVREIADVLRKNVVQARKLEDARSAEEKERWGACIRWTFLLAGLTCNRAANQ